MEDAATPAPVDGDRLAAGMFWLVRGIAIASLGLPLVLLDHPWSLAAPVVGPLGALAVWVGVRHVVHATPRTGVALPLVVLAAVAVPLRLVAEVGALVGTQPLRAEPEAALVAQDTSLGVFDVVALVTLVVTFVGVLLLARHLRTSLVGIASDRWRQVLIGWAVASVALPLGLLTGAVELVLVAAATVLIAGALLVLSLLATYRAAVDDDLDRDWDG